MRSCCSFHSTNAKAKATPVWSVESDIWIIAHLVSRGIFSIRIDNNWSLEIMILRGQKNKKMLGGRGQRGYIEFLQGGNVLIQSVKSKPIKS